MGSNDLRPNVYFVMCFFWVLTYAIVGLRIYVRSFMIKSFGRDDTAIIVALVLFTAYLCCQATAVTHGIGRQRVDIPDKDLPIGFAAWLFAELFYTSSTSVLKISIGFFLLRVTENRMHKYLLWTMMGGTVTVGTVYFFVALFQCSPISFYWDFSPNAKGTCISPEVMVVISYIASALNGIADWVFGLLPIFLVKDLNMKRKTKIVVSCILGFAAIGSLSTIIRLPYVKQLGVYKGNFLYTSTYIAIWSTVEVGVGISAASLATLRPLAQKIFPNMLEQSNQTAESQSKWSARLSKKAGGKKKNDPLESYASGENQPTVTTTVTGAQNQYLNKSGNGSQENIIPVHDVDDVEMMAVKTWDHGISKSVQVTTIEERNNSQSSVDLEERTSTPTGSPRAFENV